MKPAPYTLHPTPQTPTPTQGVRAALSDQGDRAEHAAGARLEPDHRDHRDQLRRGRRLLHHHRWPRRNPGSPLLLKLTEVPLLLREVPLSTFVSVGSALGP